MSDYLPIEHYGAIGNLRTVALVGLNGSLDWCCLPDLDSPSVFAAILDHSRGGRFRIAPAEIRGQEQRYLENTNVLETVFEVEGGRLVLTDFMPLAGDIEGLCRDSSTEPAVHRLLRAEGGPLAVEVEWAPRLDMAHGPTQLMRTGSEWLAWVGSDSLVLAGLPEGAQVLETGLGPELRARFEMRPGERRALSTRWGSQPVDLTLEDILDRLQETVTSWRRWVDKEEATGDRAWAGPYSAQVIRSELALKLLTYAETGAIAAAATTSLPEEVGGVRNWDYRMSWIRECRPGRPGPLLPGSRRRSSGLRPLGRARRPRPG
jgi:GH15 family glucan-1,4-alpha-glucosidase